ncbi:MAG TPA: TIR domain-containing protein [Rhizomicrobium sp.]|nr:TIR domain-containing protein [Rhizomicrobium sp.]
MAGEIFISYRRADEAWARLLHAQLRAEGVEAWYDALVGPGQDWRVSTAKALEASEIFVLLFSENAAQSSDIAKELAAATLEKKLIIPIRLQNIAPKGAFLYELASRNWINAYEDTEAKLGEVAKGLAHLVRTGARDESVLPFDHSARSGQPRITLSRIKQRPLIIVAASIVAVAALFWFNSRPATVVASSQQSPGPAGISVAVLPFLNLSGDPKQDYFSDGMTEEITSALAEIPHLPVVGRTSAFAFKGKNEDLQVIGKTLRASYLLEGSVRQAGDKVRITAQLIKAATGDHVWTDSYDRELKDIFAVQEDVARAIAGALQVPLGLKAGENLVSDRSIDPLSYQDYLRAKSIFRARNNGAPVTAATALLELIVAKHPDYEPAWALLAQMEVLAANYGSNALTALHGPGDPEALRRLAGTAVPKAEADARHAIALNPRSSGGYLALALVQWFRGQMLDAEQSFKQALSIDPQNSDTLHWYSGYLGTIGKINEAVAMRDQLYTLEPLVANFNMGTVRVLVTAGDNAKALAMALALPPTSATRALNLAEIYASLGRYKEAADALRENRVGASPERTEAARRILLAAPASVKGQNVPYLGVDSFVFAYVGLPERAFDFVQHNADAGYNYGSYTFQIWQPDYAPGRKTERFKALVRKMGLVDYWRARGWPVFCHPVGTDDFACD